jgi:MoaA/NifB/PqqE/SkfB family radical SAM enzyme
MSSRGVGVELSIDIEITNRCNAKCHFCPRDMTPHEGTMAPELFDVALARAVEVRALTKERSGTESHVSLCGLGEPLLNKHAPRYVGQVKAEGFRCLMASNGSLLSREKGEALVEAGLDEILINIGDIEEEYEAVYHLPFAKTRDNIARFVDIAAGHCDVTIVLVDHHQDKAHVESMKAYWQEYGVTDFLTFEIMNRGGSLFVDHMQYEAMPQLARARELLAETGSTPRCAVPLLGLFVGYDGQYYLCCSDWEKQTPMGSVHDLSFEDVLAAKLDYVTSRTPVCRTCNIDPVNQLTEKLQAFDEGRATQAQVDALVSSISASSALIEAGAASIGLDTTAPPAPARKLIPVSAD